MGSKPSSQRKIIVPDQSKGEQNGTDDTVQTNNRNENDLSFGKPLLVTAIDFGTTYSGYVFCFKAYREKILTGNQGYMQEDERVPTIVLLNPDQTFNSFGYEARETYSKLGEEKANYFYFEHFKMAMYKNMKSSSEANTAVITDIRGKQVKAQDILVMLIENLLYLAMDTANRLQKEDITWIITIPAMWSDLAKEIVKRSALSVGIADKNLHFVLEPHAAAVYCMQDRLHAKSDHAGKKCILLDIGGCSTDVWVYEVKGENAFEEIHKATEEIGGQSVNDGFIELMEGLVGETVWSEFRENHRYSYNTIMSDFDRKKRSFSNEDATVTMSIEKELLDVLEENTGETLSDVIKKIGADEKIQFKSKFNKLVLDKETIEELFEKSVDDILEIVEKTLNDCKKWNIHTMFVVGGFSESPYLREIIKSKINNTRVVFLADAKLAVLKGAVMMGYKS